MTVPLHRPSWLLAIATTALWVVSERAAEPTIGARFSVESARDPASPGGEQDIARAMENRAPARLDTLIESSPREHRALARSPGGVMIAAEAARSRVDASRCPKRDEASTVARLADCH